MLFPFFFGALSKAAPPLTETRSYDIICDFCEYGVFKDYRDDIFRPGNNATRAEAVTFLYKFFSGYFYFPTKHMDDQQTVLP